MRKPLLTNLFSRCSRSMSKMWYEDAIWFIALNSKIHLYTLHFPHHIISFIKYTFYKCNLPKTLEITIFCILVDSTLCCILIDSFSIKIKAVRIPGFFDNLSTLISSSHFKSRTNVLSIPKLLKLLGIPEDFKKELRVYEFPDWMEKPDKPCYRSTSVVGDCYRICRSLYHVSIPNFYILLW